MQKGGLTGRLSGGGEQYVLAFCHHHHHHHHCSCLCPQAQINVDVQLPMPFSLMPKPVVEATGNAAFSTTLGFMLVSAGSLVYLLAGNYCSPPSPHPLQDAFILCLRQHYWY